MTSKSGPAFWQSLYYTLINYGHDGKRAACHLTTSDKRASLRCRALWACEELQLPAICSIDAAHYRAMLGKVIKPLIYIGLIAIFHQVAQWRPQRSSNESAIDKEPAWKLQRRGGKGCQGAEKTFEMFEAEMKDCKDMGNCTLHLHCILRALFAN